MFLRTCSAVVFGMLVTLCVPSANAQLGEFDDLLLKGFAPDVRFLSASSAGEASPPTLDFRILSRSGGSSIDLDSTDNFCVARVREAANQGSVTLNENGLGLGTGSPTAPLHIVDSGVFDNGFNNSAVLVESSGAELDRLMVNLINNGGTFMNFQDTSISPVANWQIFTKNDAFFLRKAGPAAAGMNIRANGGFAFTFGGLSNFTIQPGGDAFIRGTLRTGGPVLGGSDRNTKENITTVDPQVILDKVDQLPVTTWSYIADEDHTRHIGPMAQDFKRLFEVGIDDKTIAYMDKDGVALAAIQGLSSNAAKGQAKVAELEKLIAMQKAQLQSQSELLAKQQLLIQTIDERMQRIENTVPLASVSVTR